MSGSEATHIAYRSRATISARATPENQEAALEFLDRFNRMPVQHESAPVKELPDKDVLCTQTGQVMLDQPDAKSLMEVIREYYEAHKAQPARDLKAEYFRGRPAPWKVAEYKNSPPSEGEIAWEFAGSTKAGEVQIDKYLLHHSGSLVKCRCFIFTRRPVKSVRCSCGSARKAKPKSKTGRKSNACSVKGTISFPWISEGSARPACSYTAVSPDIDPTLGTLVRSPPT